MSDDPPASTPAKRGLQFNGEINLGAVIQASVVLCGLVAWAITSANRSQTAADGLTTLQVTVDKSMAGLQTTLTAQNADLRRELVDLQHQVANLPFQTARLDQFDQWRKDVEQRFINMDNRAAADGRTIIQTRSDVDGMLRAPLLPRGRAP